MSGSGPRPASLDFAVPPGYGFPAGSARVSFLSTVSGHLGRFGALFRRVTSSGSYVPQIDGMRLLAILPVILWHLSLRVARFSDASAPGAQTAMGLVPHGHIGVTLFFFISGYIISYPFVIGRAPSLARFFARRLVRIEPPYVIALLICFVPLGLFHYVPEKATSFSESTAPLWQSLLASMAYMHGLLFNAPSRLDPPAWSLEVELQFYVLSPFLLYLYCKIPGLARRAVAMAALGLACIVATHACDMTLGRDGVQQYTIMAHAYAFLTGVVASDWASRAKPFERATRLGFDAAMVAGLLGLAVSGVFERFPHGFAALVLDDIARAVLVLMVYLGACRGRYSRPMLGYAPVAIIGGMVYSIYLTHVPILQAFSAATGRLFQPLGFWAIWIGSLVVLVPIVLACGAAFFLLVEKPFMNPRLPQQLLDVFKPSRLPQRRGV